MKTVLFSLFLIISTLGGSQYTTGNAWVSSSISYRVSDFTFGLEEGIRFTETRINQTYSDVSVKYKFNKYLRTGFTWRNAQKNGLLDATRIDNRFSGDILGRFTETQVNQTYSDVSVKYKFNKYLRTGFTWRNAQKNGFLDANRIDNRFSGDILGRFKKKKKLTYLRVRYQSKYKDWFVRKNGDLPESYLRTKLGFRYTLRKKLNLETAAESYYAFKNDARFINRYRIYFGVNYRIKKQHAIELSYIYQSRIQEANPETGHILSLSYSYDLNAALKKRRKRKKKQQESK